MTRALGGLLLACAFGALQGCGAKTGDVSGKVFLGEAPIVSGWVTLIASDTTTHRSQIASDGSYQIKSVPVGTALIVVASPRPNRGNALPIDPKKATPAEMDKIVKKQSKSDPQDPNWREIPSAYSDPGNPRLKYVVVAGPNEHHIKMDEKPRP